MTLVSIDATINDQRLNADKAEVAKTMQLLKSSQEFSRLVNVTTAIGLSHLGVDPVANVNRMLEFVENVMAFAANVGYNIHKQEVGARELEMSFSQANGR